MDDPTYFSQIEPLIEADVTGTNLTRGTINVMSYGYVDNIIIYVGEPSAAVDPDSGLTSTWGSIKAR